MYIEMLYPRTERELFTNREDVLMMLDLALEDVRRGAFKGFTLFGIRRSGKTLILKEFLTRAIRDPTINVVYVDFEGFPKDPREMVDRFFGAVLFWLKTRGYGNIVRFLDIQTLARSPSDILKGGELNKLLNYMTLDKLDLKLRSIFKLLVESEKPSVLILDEFQDFLITLLSEKVDPLGIMREMLRSKTLLILSGSVRSIMRKIAKDFRERYFLQLRNIELTPFNLKSTWELAEKILQQTISGRLAARILRMSGGFPFYIHAITERAKELTKIFEVPIKEALELAYYQEVFTTRGMIYEHCRYLWTEYIMHAKRKRYLRKILELVSEKPLTASQIARTLNTDYSIAVKYVDELLDLGLIVKENNKLYIFNRTFATWIQARKELPEINIVMPYEKTILRKLRELEKRVAIAEKIASHNFEMMAQILVATLLGKTLNPRELGETKLSRIKLPTKVIFNPTKKKNNKIYELDILLENGQKVAIEITISKIDAKYIEETINIWKADIYWFISYKGFTQSAKQLIEKNQTIILTQTHHLEQILRRIATQDWAE